LALSAGSGCAEGAEARAQRQLLGGWGILNHLYLQKDSALRREAMRELSPSKNIPSDREIIW